MMQKFTKEQRATAWATVYSGERFNYLAPSPDMIHINDIAVALSKQCRYNGHLPDIGPDELYVVAQHSVLTSQVINTPAYLEMYPEDGLVTDTAPWALHHDDTEYVVGDMVSPIKRLHPTFGEMEDGLAPVFRTKFNIPFNAEIEAAVHRADYFMYWLESNTMQASIPAENKSPNPLSVGLHDVFPDFYLWSPSEARDRFLARHEELQAGYEGLPLAATG